MGGLEAVYNAAMGTAMPVVLTATGTRCNGERKCADVDPVASSGYGCGPEKFVAVVRVMGGIEISLPEAERVVQEFRSSNRRITALWNRLQTEFQRSANSDYEIELPSGRRLASWPMPRNISKPPSRAGT